MGWMRLNGNKRMRPTLALQDSKQAAGHEPTLQWLPSSGVVTSADSEALSPSLQSIAAATQALSLDGPASSDGLAASQSAAVQSAQRGVSDLYASSTPVAGLGSPVSQSMAASIDETSP